MRDGGTLVLNADEEEASRLLEVPRVREGEKRVVHFSVRENHPLIKRHLDEGGTAYFVRDGWVVEGAGRIAARGFRRLVIKEDADNRGRERGAVARLLCEDAASEAPLLGVCFVLNNLLFLEFPSFGR